MARKRMIDPDLWSDDRVQSLPSAMAVAFYIGTISFADDEGRIGWSPAQLWGRIFPQRFDVKLRDIEAAMEAISTSGLVAVYAVAGRSYAVHPNWRKHQYVNKPTKSKIPEPPREDDDGDDATDYGRLHRNGQRSADASGSAPRPVPLESESESESESDWCGRLRSATDELRKRGLDGLTTAEQFELARRVALEFGNCSRSERTNKARARSVAAGIAQLKDRLHRDRVSLTVDGFLTACRNVWIRGGKVPWFKVFDVLAEITVPR